MEQEKQRTTWPMARNVDMALDPVACWMIMMRGLAEWIITGISDGMQIYLYYEQVTRILQFVSHVDGCLT